MNKRIGFTIVLILAVLALVTSCAGGAQSATGNITLWHSWKESEIPALNKVIEGFKAENPEVTFDVLYVPFDDLRGKFETAAATGGGPTVLIGAADWGPALFDADLVADVSDLASAGLIRSINDAALGAVEYKGATIGLPQTIKGVIMFRNKKIIPNAPRTMDDLIKAAQAAQGTTGADLERGFFFSAGHLMGIGGKLMEDNGDPAFNNAKGVAWVKLLQSFSQAGPTEYNTDNDVNLFKAVQAGIIIDGTWNMTGLAEAIGAENLVIDPWPRAPGGSLSGFVQTENIYMSANATGADKDAAWAFMAYFLSKEAQTMLTEAGHIPAITGVNVTDIHMQQAVKAFEDGAVFPVIPEMNAYWESMDTALQSVFDENVDPAVALQRAHDSITAKIREIRAGQ